MSDKRFTLTIEPFTYLSNVGFQGRLLDKENPESIYKIKSPAAMTKEEVIWDAEQIIQKIKKSESILKSGEEVLYFD